MKSLSLISVLESEVQALVTLVGSSRQVGQLLLGGHRIPFRVPMFVPEDIVQLHQAVEGNIHAEDRKQLSVTPPV